MHRSQSTETRGSKGMRPLNRRFAPPIRGWRPSERIRISNLCPLLFLDSELLGQAPDTGGVAAPLIKRSRSLTAQTGWLGLTNCFEMHSLSKVPFLTTPSAPLKKASRLLIDVASTPPMSRVLQNRGQ